MRTLMPSAVVLGLVMFCWPCHAEIRIVKSNGEPVPDGSSSMFFNIKTGGWDIALLELYAPSLDTVFEIHANAGETIDNVFINVDGPAAGSPVVVRLIGDAPGYLRSVGNIIQNGTAETILNKVIVTEDIGSVQVEAIGDLIAGRDVIGPIVATTSGNSVRGITNVKASRHILGDVLADNGRILLVQAQGGNIGSPSKPVEIRSKYHLYHIEGKDVYANINSRMNGGTGGLFALIAERFIGTLMTEQLIVNPWLSLDGRIYITQQFAGSITLGKSMTSAAQYMQVPVQGLGGQIIINADNVSTGSWTSPVRVGPMGDPNQIILNNPAYPQTPTQLGGGSVGLVPFTLHDEACVPANGASVELTPNSPPLVVQLRHYGPVNWEGPPPLTIERRVAGTSGSFQQLQISNFNASASDTNSNVMHIAAMPGTSGFEPGFEYRITNTNQLRCKVPSAPPVSWEASYEFTVTMPPCDGDINSDGVVNVNDLIFVINFWGPAQPVFPAPDVNGDGFVNVTDLLAVIGNWGACW